MTVWITVPTAAAGLDLFAGLLTLRSGPADPDAIVYLLASLIGLVLLDRREFVRVSREGSPDPATNARLIGFAMLIVGIVVFSGSPTRAFLYFQF
ncbi:hypothetical protein B7486_71070 [cyanobacterium TDX16]|nr:hypothetical protein B7486_71070 [cyanobacterium TDX16]